MDIEKHTYQHISKNLHHKRDKFVAKLRNRYVHNAHQIRDR